MFKSFKFAFVLAAIFGMLITDAPRTTAASKTAFRTGVVVTPRNFPDHSAADLADMFKLNSELGSFSVIRINWNDSNRLEVARTLVALGAQRGLDAVVELSPFKADALKGAELAPPKNVAAAAGDDLTFANPTVAEPFSLAVLELAALKPPFLAVATDVNLYAATNPRGLVPLANLYAKLFAQIKQISPKTQVFVTFQWDAMQGKDAASNHQLIAAFGNNLELLALTSEPRKLFDSGGPSAIPRDFYARISAFEATGRPVFLEVNWPSDGNTGESDQVSFIQNLPAQLASLNPALLAWTFLHDVKVFVFTVRAGLLNADGQPKPAFAAFRAMSDDRPTIRAPAISARARGARAPAETVSREAARFGIYTARLDGTGVQTLMTSPDREMTHPRVSPDRARIVLTRYNARDKDGYATEDQGYDNTEIAILNLDGSGLETIIAAEPGVIAANGCWTPDGKSLIFISTDNTRREPEIRQIDLATRKISRVPTPQGLKATDPHWEGNQVVFPVKGDDADALWVMRADGSGARQVTRPPKALSLASGNFGDFDPKLSPDGSKIAFMRIAGGNAWRVMTLDMKTGEERELTPQGVIEGLPTWSGDGRILLFRHIDMKKPREIGLYTMTPEGNDRKIVPLPRGYLYNHGSFFPGEGSSPESRIIYTGTENPGL